MRSRRYDLLAALLQYPEDDYEAALSRCILALENGGGGEARLLGPLRDRARELSCAGLQEMYTRTFDINPVCTLEVGWHVYGEDYARGAFLVKMREMLREHRIAESRELPDHLTHVLMLLGRLAGEEADELAARYVLPALEKMMSGMDGAEHPYRSLLETITTVVRRDHEVKPVAPRARRGDPPDWNRRLPMLGGLSADGARRSGGRKIGRSGDGRKP